ncbi:MAG: voltage-gated potassium channel [Myxococcota bacterium]|jgi:voltage-gated potassium channel
MTGHVIVAGVGRVGRGVVLELCAHGVEVLAIDSDPERLVMLKELIPDVETVEADAFEHGLLERVGIQRARGFVTTLQALRDNLFLCIGARKANADAAIVSRVADMKDAPKFRSFGVSVVNPADIGGNQLAGAMSNPALAAFVRSVTEAEGHRAWVLPILIPAGSPIAGLRLSEADLQSQTGCIILGVRGRRPGPFAFRPKDRVRFRAGGALLALGEEGQLAQLTALVEAT